MKVGGGEGEDDRDDLTTKGKKRKRLAKACSACHVSWTLSQTAILPLLLLLLHASRSSGHL